MQPVGQESNINKESQVREGLEKELIGLGEDMKQLALDFKSRIQQDEKVI